MKSIPFGAGYLFGVPVAGNLATNPTPVEFGEVQEASLEFKAELKKAYGNRQYPLAQARTKFDVTVKGKLLGVDPFLMAQLYFGIDTVAGMKVPVVDEAATIPGDTAYTITVDNNTDFDCDLGVKIAGVRLTKVTGAPSAGQYSVVESGAGKGVYTFNVGDKSKAVQISYVYADTDRGETLSITSKAMGHAPEFKAFLFNDFRDKVFGVQLNDCTMGSMTWPSKQEDFYVSDFDFSCSVDASDEICKFFFDNDTN